MCKQWVPGSFVRLHKILEPGDKAKCSRACKVLLSSFLSDQKLEMKSCVAYKDVTASQSSPHKAPQQSKNVYDNPDVGTVSDDDAESLYDNI